MAEKPISTINLTDTLSISECRDGFWIYDKTRGCNLAMRAKTERDAFVEVISYYQKRTKEVEAEFKILNDAVQNFVSIVSPEEED